MDPDSSPIIALYFLEFLPARIYCYLDIWLVSLSDRNNLLFYF